MVDRCCCFFILIASLLRMKEKNIRIYHECEGKIEKSVPRMPFGITRLAE